METKLYEGFGKKFPAAEWAKRLNLSPSAFEYYATNRGLTVEELYTLKGLHFRDRVRGRWMDLTYDRVAEILIRSGFTDLSTLELTTRPGKAVHIIAFDGSDLGEYYYRENRLVLNNGEGLPLDRLTPEKVQIIRNRGIWTPHPDTKMEMLSLVLR